MLRRPILFAAVAAVVGTAAIAQTTSREIDAAVAAATRTPANVARDKYRHPAQTLVFFGVKPSDTVVEFIPGGGWYTEILAPLVRKDGRYIALVGKSGAEKAKAMLDGKAAMLGPTTLATIDPATGATTIPAGSADVVLTFRNVHNLVMNDDTGLPAKTFAAFFTALKPGGVLGVVDHRLPEEMDTALEKKSGYIKRSTIMRLAEGAGFRLQGESPINANPKDTHDHPEGVWTLPPTYALKDVDRAKYAAIGESDRMTLRFVKPK